MTDLDQSLRGLSDAIREASAVVSLECGAFG